MLLKSDSDIFEDRNLIKNLFNQFLMHAFSVNRLY